jgi:hypothetical protein
MPETKRKPPRDPSSKPERLFEISGKPEDSLDPERRKLMQQ